MTDSLPEEEHDLCLCGHVRQDHGLTTGACTVGGCECIRFEVEYDDEWDGDEDHE